jgi:AraC family transcriptional activator of pobA
LLETHFQEHWKVSDYARALAVTPTHLTRIARAATAAAVSRLIDARVMREARRNLAYTSMGVSTIAFALGPIPPTSRGRSRAPLACPRGASAPRWADEYGASVGPLLSQAIPPSTSDQNFNLMPAV